MPITLTIRDEKLAYWLGAQLKDASGPVICVVSNNAMRLWRIDPDAYRRK